MGRPENAPSSPLDGIESNDKNTPPRSTRAKAFPPSTQVNSDVPQMYEIPHNFPPSQPSTPPLTHNSHHQPNNNNVGIMQFPHNQQHFNQPAPLPYTPVAQLLPSQLPNQAWRTGLFDCMQDPQNAIITACFPCVTFGQIAEIADSGTTSCATSGMWYSCIAFCIAMPCIMSCTYRSKMRAILGLVESPAPDWVVHCFCEWCALCQEYRELKERGYDPAIGWAGNVAIQRQKQQASMAPPMHQRMM